MFFSACCMKYSRIRLWILKGTKTFWRDDIKCCAVAAELETFWFCYFRYVFFSSPSDQKFRPGYQLENSSVRPVCNRLPREQSYFSWLFFPFVDFFSSISSSQFRGGRSTLNFRTSRTLTSLLPLPVVNWTHNIFCQPLVIVYRL